MGIQALATRDAARQECELDRAIREADARASKILSAQRKLIDAIDACVDHEADDARSPDLLALVELMTAGQSPDETE